MADGTREIINARREVFGQNTKRFMCWAHKYRAYKPKLASLRKVNKLLADEVDSDIKNIQWMVTSEKEFRVVYDLLEGKYINGNYNEEEKDLLSIFFKYHRQQWGPDSHAR